jgi:radical SAM protein with 4Fe4S-binding SPASM domain
VTVQELTYNDLTTVLHREGARARMPLDGMIEVTHRCPLACRHCYNNLPMADQEAREAELSLAEHVRIVDEITAAGCLWLCYTGGEIFARPDFLDIYTAAKDRGLLLTLFTNGTLITPRIADHLARYRPFALEITLYGATRETYERLTQEPGSYDRCLRGIRLLQERGLPLSLKTVAVSINRHEVWEMKRLAEEELGLRFKFDAMLNPRTDCSQSPLGVRLNPADVVAFDLDDPARVAEWRRVAEQFRKLSFTQEEKEEVYHCGGGLNAFAIDPYGRLSICVLSHQEHYDLRRGSFREGWEQFLAAVRHRKRTRVTRCTQCELKAMCGMCPATGELENGDPESPVDFLCHVAHLRAHAFELPVAEHGDCPYCARGEGYERLQRSLQDLMSRPEGRRSAPANAPFELPVLAGPMTKGGCGSCGLAASRL